MKRRWWSSFLVLLMVFSVLTGCQSGTGTAGNSSTTAAETAVSQQTTAVPETEGGQATAVPETPAETVSRQLTTVAETAAETVSRQMTAAAEAAEEELLDEDGSYNSKEEVALYLHQYGHLPDNYITKKEAQNLGWSGGSLEPYAPGCAIGGSRFGNYEGNLPEKKGRQYWECDIDTLGRKNRGARRIVYSNDGLIYYTDDHYETFELLYGEE